MQDQSKSLPKSSAPQQGSGPSDRPEQASQSGNLPRQQGMGSPGQAQDPQRQGQMQGSNANQDPQGWASEGDERTTSGGQQGLLQGGRDDTLEPSDVQRQRPQQQQAPMTGSAANHPSRTGASQQGDPSGEDPGSSAQQVQGEGDYEAARRHRESVERFVESGAVDEAARDAAPRDAAEAEALSSAERAGQKPARH